MKNIGSVAEFLLDYSMMSFIQKSFLFNSCHSIFMIKIISSFPLFYLTHNLKRLNSQNLNFEYVFAGNRRLLEVASLKPNVVVAQDGSGQHKSINEALKTVPQNNAQPYVISIKAGIYNENVQVAATMKNVVFIGEGTNKTKITGNKNYLDGLPIFLTATVCKYNHLNHYRYCIRSLIQLKS